MRYLSLFSGIEAATVAWHPLGWECAAVAEIEPFPCAVLAHHYPNVPNLGDVTKITEQDIKALGHIDVVVFGSPCQDLSVAGHRKGLINADGTVTRSGLFFTAINIARWSGARFRLWENVPGAYSSNKGRDFAAVVEFMAGLDDLAIPENGWGTEGCAVGDNGLLEWACLDAQWFGIPQRRRRVFAILDSGDWSNRPPILLEPESLRGNTAPSRGAREEVAGTITQSLGRSRGAGWPADVSCAEITTHRMVAFGEYSDDGTASTIKQRDYKDATDLVAIAFDSRQDCVSSTERFGSLGSSSPQAQDVAYGIPGNWIGRKPENGGNAVEPMIDVAPCQTKTDRHGVVYVGGIDYENNGHSMSEPTGPLLKGSPTGGGRPLPAVVSVSLRGREGGATAELGDEVGCCLRARKGGGDKAHVLANTQVRRLTPVECARLQGFPDHYLDITYRNKPAADGNKYRALGNSMAVPVMAHIGRKIQEATE